MKAVLQQRGLKVGEAANLGHAEVKVEILRILIAGKVPADALQHFFACHEHGMHHRSSVAHPQAVDNGFVRERPRLDHEGTTRGIDDLDRGTKQSEPGVGVERRFLLSQTIRVAKVVRVHASDERSRCRREGLIQGANDAGVVP